MIDWATSTALTAARSTLESARRIIRILKGAREPGSLISMAPRQADELARFLIAYRTELAALVVGFEKSPEDPLYAQSLIERQTALDEAVAFVRTSFIAPRRQGDDQQALEAADWMCVEIYDRFISETNGPIGPLVAVDARRSPAIWESVDDLPLPSLFRVQSSLLERAASPETSETVLAHFPVICVPATLTRSPQFLPLLSHEVGHAVDRELRLSDRVLADLSSNDCLEYWTAWIREIIADFFGLMVSGNAFPLALEGYVRFMAVSDEITTSSSYPGIRLRLAFLGDAIEAFRGSEPRISDRLCPAESLGRLGDDLRAAFLSDVLPQLVEKLQFDSDVWRAEQSLIRTAAHAAMEWTKNPEKPLSLPITSFALLPSVVALSQFEGDAFDSLQLFRSLHQMMSSHKRPDWVQSFSNWQFTEDTLPALRPTFLASDGQTKIPPVELLRFHDRAVFVGATIGQLASPLKAARQARGGPWQSLDFFFLNDEGLAQIERDADSSISSSDVVPFLIRERDAAMGQVRTLLESGIALRWAMYLFQGPLIFFSGWDLDEPGGRIHVSYQLLGTDLRKCPSTDLVWHDVVPSVTYQKYRKHLEKLRDRATLIASSLTAPPETPGFSPMPWT